MFLPNWDVWRGVVIYCFCSVFYKSCVWWIYVVIAGLFANKCDNLFCYFFTYLVSLLSFWFYRRWIDSCSLVWTLDILSAVMQGTSKVSNMLMLALCVRKDEVYRALGRFISKALVASDAVNSCLKILPDLFLMVTWIYFVCSVFLQCCSISYHLIKVGVWTSFQEWIILKFSSVLEVQLGSAHCVGLGSLISDGVFYFRYFCFHFEALNSALCNWIFTLIYTVY